MVSEGLQQRFPARVEELANVLSFVMGDRAWARLDQQRGTEFQVAIEEAFVNICTHGSLGPMESVTVRVGSSEAGVEVELEDPGEPFDPLSTPEQTPPEALDEISVGGRGVHLMRQMSDEIRYRRQGGRNILTLAAHAPVRRDS